MANPFTPQFNSTCQWCGDVCIADDDDMYAVDGDFICSDCAEENNNVCRCSKHEDGCYKFKKTKFDVCYTCNQECIDTIEF